jgi:dephospho-CoA kinase
MIRVGLTGGIGSGKTTVARVFQTLGVPVFEADAEGRRVLGEEPEVIQAVAERFGRAILRGGTVDRKALAGVVFNEPEALQALNAIVHPAVRQGFQRWAEAQPTPYVIMVSAIMVESGSSRLMDRIVVVTAPEQLRIQRVMARDGVDEGAVRARVANQISETERLAVADHVIHNDDKQLVIPQVLAIHAALLTFAKA